MDKDLVHVYFNNPKGIWIIGTRNWNGPYTTSGNLTALPYDVSNGNIGNCILEHFSALKHYSAIDENLSFFKEIRGIRSWAQFAKEMGLICIWKTTNTYEIEYNLRNADNSYSPDGVNQLTLLVSISAEEIGNAIKSLM